MEKDKSVWKQIINTIPVWADFHLDFSETICGNPKYEVQAAHFSQRQCSVMYNNTDIEGNPTYIFITFPMTSHMIQFVVVVVARHLISHFKGK